MRHYTLKRTIIRSAENGGKNGEAQTNGGIEKAQQGGGLGGVDLEAGTASPVIEDDDEEDEKGGVRTATAQVIMSTVEESEEGGGRVEKQAPGEESAEDGVAARVRNGSAGSSTGRATASGVTEGEVRISHEIGVASSTAASTPR